MEFNESISTLSFDEQQQLMARLTGNYKRGNERIAKSIIEINDSFNSKIYFRQL